MEADDQILVAFADRANGELARFTGELLVVRQCLLFQESRTLDNYLPAFPPEFTYSPTEGLTGPGVHSAGTLPVEALIVGGLHGPEAVESDVRSMLDVCGLPATTEILLVTTAEVPRAS